MLKKLIICMLVISFISIPVYFVINSYFKQAKQDADISNQIETEAAKTTAKVFILELDNNIQNQLFNMELIDGKYYLINNEVVNSKNENIIFENNNKGLLKNSYVIIKKK